MKKIYILLVCMILLLTGCGNKILTTKEITSVFTKNGFTVNDVTAMISDSNIKEAKAPNNGIYQFEFYVFKTESSAKKIFESNKKQIMNYKTKNSKESKKNKDDYEKYVLETKDTYRVIIRKGANFIYASINVENKKHFNNIMKEIYF